MLREAMRAAVEPKMTALIEEVREHYGAMCCGYPYVPMVRESYAEGPRIMICGKGAGSWGLRYAGIEGIGPGSTLANVPERDWYPEVLKVHEAFIEQGAKKYLSGEKGRRNVSIRTVDRIAEALDLTLVTLFEELERDVSGDP